MKALILTLGLLITSYAQAQGFYWGPLFSKKTRTGLVLPELAKEVTCTIYSDSIVVDTEYLMTKMTVKNIKKLAINKKSPILDMIEDAKNGEFETTPARPDIATAVYFAYEPSESGNEAKSTIVLKNLLTETQEYKINTSIAAKRLMTQIDQLCK